jgi:glutathione S-transferase
VIDLYTTSSPNGFKVTIALEELALPYMVHHIKIASGDNRQPAFLARGAHLYIAGPSPSAQ